MMPAPMAGGVRRKVRRGGAAVPTLTEENIKHLFETENNRTRNLHRTDFFKPTYTQIDYFDGFKLKEKVDINTNDIELKDFFITITSAAAHTATTYAARKGERPRLHVKANS